MVKNALYRDAGLIPGLGRSPAEGNGNALRYSCLGNPMDKGTLQAIYSTWGCKELDMTERLNNNNTSKDTGVLSLLSNIFQMSDDV